MKCPFCYHSETKVLDSRPVNENKSIRRRRECESCLRRFTTFELVEQSPLYVIKKDGSREEFNPTKLLRGLLRAFEKRPVSKEKLESLVSDVERQVRNIGQTEVKSEAIGELLMDLIYATDQVAYVRFASVYRQYKDLDMFLRELNYLKKRN